MLVQAKIRQLLDEVLGQTAKSRKGGEQALYFCFACNHYKRKLEINLSTGQYHCWTCHLRGAHLGSLLTKAKAPQSARNKMMDLTGDMRLVKRKKKDDKFELSLPEEFIPLSQPSKSLEYKQALFYLKKRGLCREDILRYNIGYCETGDFGLHIIIPSYDSEGTLNFFIGRRYYDIEGTIPYKKCEAEMNVIGFENFVNYSEPLNLCEGVFDAVAIRNNAVPLFGKYMSKKLQEAIIINKVPRVNMILDNDAMRDAIQNCVDLQRYNIPVHLVKLNGKDPSALGFKKTTELIKEAEPLSFEDIIRQKFTYDIRRPFRPKTSQLKPL
jgi:hypothetical protein